MSDLGFDIDTSGLVRSSAAIKGMGDDFAKMVATVVRENNRMAKASKDSSVALEAKARLAEANAAKMVVSAQREAAEQEKLKVKYKEGYAATALYNNIKKELARAHKLGAISAEEEAIAVDRLTKEYNEFANGGASAMNRFGKAQAAGTRRMSSMGVVTQQVGYQVGDFAVQLQSGQSAFVAFSQQATQLVGVLPLMSEQLGISTGKLIALSAGLGIGIPIVTAIGQVLWTVSKATEDAEEATTKFDKALKSAKDEVSSMKDQLRLMNSEFKTMTELTLDDEVKAAEARLKRLQEFYANNNRRGGAQRGITYDGAEGGAEANLAAAQAAVDEAVALRESVELGEQKIDQEELYLELLEAGRLATLDRNRANAEAIRDSRQEVDNLRLILQYGEDSAEVVRARAEQEAIALNLTEANAEKYVELALEANDVSIEIENSAGSAKDLADAIKDAASAMASLSGFGAGLDKALAVSIAKVNALKSGADAAVASSITAMRFDSKAKTDAAIESGADPIQAMAEGAIQQATIDEIEASQLAASKIKSDSRGGRKGRKKGGGKSDRDDFIEKLREEMDVRKRLLGVYGEERDLQEEIYRITDGLGKDRSKYSAEYINNLALENIALKEQEEIFQIKRDNIELMAQTIEDSMADAFNSIRVETESVGDAFKNMAKTIIDELLQVIIVQKVVGSFGLGDKPAGGFAGAIGSIFGGFFAEGGDVNANVPIVVGEREPELFVPRSAGTIYNQKQLASMGGSNGGKQQVELILHAPEGISIETVRSEVGLQITKAGPAIVNQSVKASQNNLKNGSKASWGI